MKIVFIYGPPGSGKLTVARELAKITKLKVFHNQITVDLLCEFFKIGSKSFWDTLDDIRVAIFKLAAKKKSPSLIFTGCYDYKKSDNTVKRYIRAVEKYGGKFIYVRLICSEKEIKKRIIAESRKQHKKIQNVKELEKMMKKKDLFKAIPFVKSLEIDNTSLSAKAVAKKIKAHYKL